jgi:hypothetical protein
MNPLVPNPQDPAGSPPPPGDGTPPAGGSGAEESVESYKVRLAGAISALDRERNTHNQTKANLATLEASLRTEISTLTVDKTALATEKALVEAQAKQAKDESAANAAELARWNVLADKPQLLLYRQLLPLTTDQNALNAAITQLETIRSKDLDRLRDLSKNGAPPPPPPAAALTKEALNRLMLEKAGTPEFDALNAAWQLAVTKGPGG